MAFGFNQAAVAQPVGVDPSLMTPMQAPQQDAPQAAPQPQQSQQYAPVQDIPVSPGEVALAMLFHGGTPAEAAQSVRAIKLRNIQDAYGLAQQRMLLDAVQNASPQQRQAMLFNPAKYGENVAANFGPVATKAGDTQSMFGGPGQGGYSQTAPLFDAASGKWTFVNPQTGQSAATPSIGGDYELKDGVVSSKRTGDVTSRYGQPQRNPLTGELQDFLPSLAGATGGATAPSQGNPQSTLSGLNGSNFFRSFVLPHEGGLNPHDMNGSPTNYGINQAANPGVNVAKLTPQQAEEIFVKKYWGPSGAANMNAPLAAVHADTYFINPKMANTFLQQSGGDPNAYLNLRETWMQHMAQTNPTAAKYASVWGQRNRDLASFIASQGGSQQASTPGDVPAQATTVAPGVTRRTLTPKEVSDHGLAAGTVAEIAPDGAISIVQQPQYDSAWDASQQKDFAGNETVKQYTSVVQPTYNALVKNIGQMTGPAAYAILDSTIRTDNPGAVTRQQQLDSFEHKFGIGAEFMGKLQNIAGKGSIPKDMQQKILDAVAPFAQSHWDAANQLYQSKVKTAQDHGRKVEDLTVPIGPRPERAIIAGNSTVTESQALAQARQAIAQGKDPNMVRHRLLALHLDPGKL